MERTYKSTVSHEGRERKIQRLIMEELRLKHKKLFARLLEEAEEICDIDDEDLMSKIHAPNKDTFICHVNPTVRRMKQRRALLAREMIAAYDD